MGSRAVDCLDRGFETGIALKDVIESLNDPIHFLIHAIRTNFNAVIPIIAPVKQALEHTISIKRHGSGLLRKM
jgi:hypothetical protein